jgi:hypothetical protein
MQETNMKADGKQSLPVSCSASSLTLKVEAICSSETSVDSQWTTQRYNPQDSSTLQELVSELVRAPLFLN